MQTNPKGKTESNGQSIRPDIGLTLYLRKPQTMNLRKGDASQSMSVNTGRKTGCGK